MTRTSQYLLSEGQSTFYKPYKSFLSRFKATLWLSESHPLSLAEQVTPIIDLMAISNAHFAKLRDFITLRLPPGFPVKIGGCASSPQCGLLAVCTYMAVLTFSKLCWSPVINNDFRSAPGCSYSNIFKGKREHRAFSEVFVMFAIG